MHTCRKHKQSKYWKDNIGWIINWLEKTIEKESDLGTPLEKKIMQTVYILRFCYFNMFVPISFQGIKWIFSFYSHVLWLFFQATFLLKGKQTILVCPQKKLFNIENWDKKLDIKYHIFGKCPTKNRHKKIMGNLHNLYRPNSTWENLKCQGWKVRFGFSCESFYFSFHLSGKRKFSV